MRNNNNKSSNGQCANDMKDRDDDVKVRQRKRNNRKSKDGSSYSGSKYGSSDQRKEALMNDVSWYAPNQQLLNDVATYPFTWPQGKPIDISNNGINFQPFASPGIMVFDIIPTVGISKDANSPLNISANALYSTLRSANSGSKNYEAPDLMLYILAMDSLYSLYAHMYRVYGLINRYSGTNLYSPRYIAEALGVNQDNFKGLQHEFKSRLDAFAFEIGRANVPNSLPIISRHQQLFSDVYVDDVSEKSQFYCFKPAGFYKFNEVDGPGKLVFTKMPYFETLDEMFDYAYEILRPVSASSDMWLISGDVGKAFGESSLVKLSLVPYEYILPIGYSEANKELLLQINNMTALPSALGMLFVENGQGELDITQDLTISADGQTGPLQFHPSFRLEKSRWVGSSGIYAHLVNMPWDAPSPADVMIATRLQHNAKLSYPDDAPEYVDFELTSCSSEIVAGISIISTLGDISQSTTFSFIEQVKVNRLTEGQSLQYADAQSMFDSLYTAKVVASFRWHPPLYRTLVHQTSDGQIYRNDSLPLMELNNYAIISHRDLDRMHDIAVKSEFGIF